MKKLLILCGPQGAGNHLFSKIFALHPKVGGWKALLDTYWIKHQFEPFVDCWRDPTKLTLARFDQFDYWFTSISIPYIDGGQLTIPPILDFYQRTIDLGLECSVGIICRDKNIEACQQLRLRGQVTLPHAEAQFEAIDKAGIPIHFISTETAVMHQSRYLKHLGTVLDFPIDYDNPRVQEFLNVNANKKYVHFIPPNNLLSEPCIGINDNKSQSVDLDEKVGYGQWIFLQEEEIQHVAKKFRRRGA